MYLALKIININVNNISMAIVIWQNSEINISEEKRHRRKKENRRNRNGAGGENRNWRPIIWRRNGVANVKESESADEAKKKNVISRAGGHRRNEDK